MSIPDKIVDRLGRLSWAARQRIAVTEFTTGGTALSDRVLGRTYFTVAASRWAAAQSQDERLDVLRAGFAAVPVAPASVVELGCGAGRAALDAAATWPTATVHGYDVSGAMIRAAKRLASNPQVRFERRSANAVRDSADLVLACNYAPYPGAVAGLLRPGGHVLITNSFLDIDTVEVTANWEKHGFHRLASGSVGAGSFAVYARTGS